MQEKAERKKKKKEEEEEEGRGENIVWNKDLEEEV